MAMTYRPDIDGLRALAVIPVIFFHSGLSIFPGGYVGVELRPLVAHYKQRNEFVTDIFSDAGARYGVRIARPQDLLCGQIHCKVMHNRIPIYSDRSHLTATFSAALADLFDPIWTDPD